MDWFEFTDLPQLQSVNLGYQTIQNVHSVVFESNGNDGLMDQIYLNYYPFNLVQEVFNTIVATIERRLVMNPTTTRIH